jgi:hypothetical protein
MSALTGERGFLPEMLRQSLGARPFAKNHPKATYPQHLAFRLNTHASLNSGG